MCHETGLIINRCRREVDYVARILYNTQKGEYLRSVDRVLGTLVDMIGV